MYFTELIDDKEQMESLLLVLKAGNEKKKNRGNTWKEQLYHMHLCVNGQVLTWLTAGFNVG